MHSSDRRRFLRRALTWPLGVQALNWSLPTLAGTGADYKALVCVYLAGGNDAYNTVLATDSASWAHYLNHRGPAAGSWLSLAEPGTAPQPGASDVSARLGGALPLGGPQNAANAGRQFALHPSLSGVAGLYAAGRVGIVANVGPLLAPLSKAQWQDGSVAVPSKLQSHIDQSATWQSFRPQGDGDGWGGRMADLLMPANLAGRDLQVWQNLACMTPASEALWLSGRTLQPCFTSASGVQTLGPDGPLLGNANVQAAVRQILQGSDSETHLLKRAQRDAARRGLAASDLLGPALPSAFAAPWGTPSATSVWDDPLLQYQSVTGGGVNDLSAQLQMVARLMEANRAGGFGVSRQMFFVTLPGFDTHDRQGVQHAQRLAQLDQALTYFDQVLAAMPAGDLRSQVTTFTISDFGRSFTSNGDGTDHGWGGHHFVMGGAVRGGQVHGRFPQYATADASGNFDSPDQLQNGMLLPAVSVDQYAATLGAWMGLSDAQLLDLLPNLNRYTSDSRNLGFMRG